MFGWLFNKKRKYTEEEEERLEEEWYDKKSEIMEALLGKEHDMVMHALIPYEIGGALDLYYYPNGIKGTAIATKELSFVCRESPANSSYDSYEFVMFTEEKLNLDSADDENTGFGKAHTNISSVLNPVAQYSEQAILNPRETCEFPVDMEEIGGKCLIFDCYEPDGPVTNEQNFGLMLIIEVFRDEMEYAMNHDGESLLRKLKEAGVYPYSNLNREPVVK